MYKKDRKYVKLKVRKAWLVVSKKKKKKKIKKKK